jgi:regulatory protein
MTPKRLRAKAIDLLSRRDHSERELQDKLRSRGGEAADVAQVLSDLRDIGLLDDRKFAQSFLSYRADKAWGRRRYRQELMARGVAAEIVDEVLAEALPPAEGPDAKLQALVDREVGRGREAQKIVASLVRRGFSYGEVRDALCRAAAGGGEGDDDGFAWQD